MVSIEIYTNRGCPACVNAKRLFDNKGVAYEEKKLGSSARMDREFLMRTKGSKSVPQIFIDGTWIGGFDDLVRYDKAGELDWRLGLSARKNVGFTKGIIRFLKGEKY